MACVGMVTSRKSDLQGLFAGLFALLLTLTGVGRGDVSGIGRPDPRVVVAGAVAPICHTAREAPGRAPPGRSGDLDCCASCALLAAAVLPNEPQQIRLAAVPILVSRIIAVALAPTTDRRRSPRQAQGPPIG